MTDLQKVERSGGGFIASPRPVVSTPRRSSLTSRLALRSIRGSGQATSSALTVPEKRNEVCHRIDGKNGFLLV
jgi:hypothetical protein